MGARRFSALALNTVAVCRRGNCAALERDKNVAGIAVAVVDDAVAEVGDDVVVVVRFPQTQCRRQRRLF